MWWYCLVTEKLESMFGRILGELLNNELLSLQKIYVCCINLMQLLKSESSTANF